MLHPHRAHLGIWTCGCGQTPHNTNDDGPNDTELKAYDSDWSATGPLIERFGINTLRHPSNASIWLANKAGDTYGSTTEAHTPLLAACNLILQLHKAHKL